MEPFFKLTSGGLVAGVGIALAILHWKRGIHPLADELIILRTMLKAILLIILVYFCASEQPRPVNWKFSIRKNHGDTLELHMKATIAKGWYIYSLNNRAGPGATEVILFKESGIKYEGPVIQLSKPKQTYDLVFKTNVLVFSRRAEFMQLVYQKDTSVMTIAGLIRFMACNGRNCLPPRSDSFQVKLN